MPSFGTRRCTRCCDAQGAVPVFPHKCHACRPSCRRVNREVSASVYAQCHLVVPVVVPVVVMLRAPVPLFTQNAMPARRGAALIVRSVPGFVIA